MEDKRGDITTASAGFSFGQGTSVALAWSQNNATDNEYQYIKLDHSYGDGSVGVYYKSGEDGCKATARSGAWASDTASVEAPTRTPASGRFRKTARRMSTSSSPECG